MHMGLGLCGIIAIWSKEQGKDQREETGEGGRETRERAREGGRGREGEGEGGREREGGREGEGGRDQRERERRESERKGAGNSCKSSASMEGEGDSIGAYHVHILFGSSDHQFKSAQHLWLQLHQLRDDAIVEQV